MKPNEKIEVCVNNTCYLAEIKSVGETVLIDYLTELPSTRSKVKITLIQGLGKQDKQEIVSKYATEFGVSEIIFVPMKRSIVQYDDKVLDKKMERFQKIALEAARLSHRDDVPNLRYERDLTKLSFSQKHKWIAYENNKNESFFQIVSEVETLDEVVILVGPEGGIDEQEIAYLCAHGFKTVGLGKRILQTEIASLYALSVLDAYMES